MSISGIGNTLPTQAAAQAGRKAVAASSEEVAAARRAQYEATVREFTDFMAMAPEERWQSQWMSARGISKEDFEAMTAEEKQKLLEEMKRDIERQLKAQAEKEAQKKGVDIVV